MQEVCDILVVIAAFASVVMPFGLFCRARYAQAGVELLRDQANSFELKESAKREVLLLWTATESIITGELSRHFVEQEVEDLEDDLTGLDPGDHERASLARRSSGNFFGVNLQQTDIDGLSAEDKLTVCPPTCRMAAPVYKDIMTFSANVKALLCEEIDSSVEVVSLVQQAVQR